MTPIRPGGSGTESRLIADMNVTPMVVNRWMVDCQTARHTQATTEA